MAKYTLGICWIAPSEAPRPTGARFEETDAALAVSAARTISTEKCVCYFGELPLRLLKHASASVTSITLEETTG